MLLNATTVEGISMGASVFIMLAPFLLLAGVFFIPMCPSIDDCNTYWGQFPFAFLYWLCIPLFFFAITMAVVMSELREYFSENFEEYRCKPWFMPFVSYVRGDVSVQDNFYECTNAVTSVAYSIMASPLLDASEGVGEGLNIGNETLTKVHNDHVGMASTVSKSFERTYEEADKYSQISKYVLLKMKALFDRLVAVVFNVYYALVSMMDMLNLAMKAPDIIMSLATKITIVVGILYVLFLIFSIWYNWKAIMAAYKAGILATIWTMLPASATMFSYAGFKAGMAVNALLLHFVFFAMYTLFTAIIIAMTILRRNACKKYEKMNQAKCLLCFAKDTMVIDKHGQLRPIQSIQPGEMLYHNIRVEGTLSVDTPPHTHDWYCMSQSLNPLSDSAPMYVTGSHQWWDSRVSQWKTMQALHEEAPDLVTRVPATNAPRTRYCLVTSTNVIPTTHGWFADYQETSDSNQLANDAIDILYELNNANGTNIVDVSQEKGERSRGLDVHATQVVTDNASQPWVHLRDIRVGDRVVGGGRVLGIYEGIQPDSNKHLAPDQIVWDEQSSRWAKQYSLKPHETNHGHVESQQTTMRPTRHLVTEHGEYTVRFEDESDIWRIRDFIERLR